MAYAAPHAGLHWYAIYKRHQLHWYAINKRGMLLVGYTGIQPCVLLLAYDMWHHVSFTFVELQK